MTGAGMGQGSRENNEVGLRIWGGEGGGFSAPGVFRNY